MVENKNALSVRYAYICGVITYVSGAFGKKNH